MKRPMALIGFTYAVSMAAFSILPENQKLNAFIVLLPILILSLLVPQFKKNKALTLFLSTCTLAAGICFANYKINIEPVQQYAGKSAKIGCIIDDIPQNRNNHLYYHAKVESVNGKNIRPFYTIISASEPLECDLDDKFFCDVHFYLPQSSYFFDSNVYYSSKKIYIKALFDMQSETKAETPENHSLKYYILNFKSKMLEVPKVFLSEELANVQNAIFLGEKSNINNSLENVFLKNGVYHLLTTSGVHITIIMSLFLWIFKKMKLNHKAAQLLTILPILTFVGLTGFTESAMRSGINCTLYLLGVALLKSTDSLNSLGLATFLICLFSPGSSLSLGLWLSVLAVLGIILFYKNISSFVHSLFLDKFKKYKITCVFVASVSTSIAVNLFTAPITIIYSKMFSLVQFISNLFILPLTSMILILTLIVSLLGVMQLPKLVLYPVAFINGLATKITIAILRGFANLPFSYISLDYPFSKLWIGLTIVIFAVCLLLFKRPRSIVLSVILAIDTLLCGIISYRIFNYNSANISFVNCNDGIACVIRKNNRTACITYFGEKNYTDNFEDFIESNNIDNIDYFAVPYCDFYPNDLIENISLNHSFNSFILPGDINKDIIKNLDSNAIFFTEDIDSTLWDGNLEIKIRKQSENTYTEINIEGLNILIMPNTNNCNDLPEDWRSFDIVVTSGVPLNFDKLQTNSIILYGSEKTIYESIDKIPPNIKSYNLAYYTKLSLIYKNKKYKVGV